MAIFYLNCSQVLRNKGQSMVGKAAYGAGVSIYDRQKRRTYNHSKREDVLAQFIALPQKAPQRFKCRKTLWNESEQKEKGKRCVGYEIIICVPYELKVTSSINLLKRFTQTLAEFYNCAVDCAFHIPPQDSPYHDKRNMHAHILVSRRCLDHKGFTDELSALRRRSFSHEILRIRRCWELLTNQALQDDGLDVRIDHRSLKEQGIDRVPQIHVGKRAKYLHLAGKVPPSKKKRRKGRVLTTSSMTRDARAMRLTRRSKRLTGIRRAALKNPSPRR
jgi:hypothetical protein